MNRPPWPPEGWTMRLPSTWLPSRHLIVGLPLVILTPEVSPADDTNLAQAETLDTVEMTRREAQTNYDERDRARETTHGIRATSPLHRADTAGLPDAGSGRDHPSDVRGLPEIE